MRGPGTDRCRCDGARDGVLAVDPPRLRGAGPSALHQLLDAIETAPSVGVAGCKQVAWDDDQALLDVGWTTSVLGSRITGVDRFEVDQGQHDDRSDVLAVGTPGMLVRSDVWDRLSGLNPDLTPARVGLDLCRRARLAGHRVVVVPRAVVACPAVRGRGRSAPARGWVRADRRDAVHLRLACSPWLMLPLALAWTLLVAPLRAAGRLVLRQPAAAVAELTAPLLVLAGTRTWLRSRRRIARARTVPHSVLRRLRAGPRAVVRQRRDDITSYLLSSRRVQAGGRRPDADEAAQPVHAREQEPGPVAEEAQSLPVAVLSARSRSVLVACAVALGVAAASTAALRAVWPGRGTPGSDVLLPVPDHARALWQAARSSWRAVGLGAPALADPFTAVLAGLGLPAGSPRVAVTALILLAVPLSAVSAYTAAGALTSSRALRAWAGLVWAVAPPLLAADTSGRLGAALAHVLLPLAALALARAVLRGSVAAASAAGVLVTLVLACAPSLAAPVVVSLLAVAVVAGPRRRLLAWTALVPAVVLLPWWRAVAADPVLLLADPSSPAAAGPAAPRPWWLVVGLPVSPSGLLGGPAGAPGRWVSGVPWLPGPHGRVLAVAACALVVPVLLLALPGLAGRRARASLPAGAAVLAGLGIAVLAARTDVAAVPGGSARGWPGAGLSLYLLGALVAAVLAWEGMAHRPVRRGARRRLTVLAAGCVAAGVVGMQVATLAAWAWHGWADAAGSAGVHRVSPDVLPAVAATDVGGPAATRSLVLRADPSSLRWSLVRQDSGPRLGDGSAALAARRLGAGNPDDALVAPVLALLLSDTGRDPRPALADLAISTVLLLPPLDEQTALALDSTPGLVRAGSPGGTLVWRVDPAGPAAAAIRTSRVRVVSREGVTLAAIPSRGLDVRAGVAAGAPGRRLVLAERFDPGWHATLDGRWLTAGEDAGWPQSFALPSGGGRLVVQYGRSGQALEAAAGVGVGTLALLMALPIAYRRAHGPGLPRPSRPVPRGPVGEGRRGRPRGAPLGTDEAAQRWVDQGAPAPSDPPAAADKPLDDPGVPGPVAPYEVASASTAGRRLIARPSSSSARSASRRRRLRPGRSRCGGSTLSGLPFPARAPVLVCPGPETLLAPDGADPLPSPGPVRISAAVAGEWRRRRLCSGRSTTPARRWCG